MNNPEYREHATPDSAQVERAITDREKTEGRRSMKGILIGCIGGAIVWAIVIAVIVLI